MVRCFELKFYISHGVNLVKKNQFLSNYTNDLQVFIWTIKKWGPIYHTTELLVDNSVVHAVFLNPGNVTDGTVTGTVVVYVTKDSEILDITSSSFNKVLEDRCRHPPPCNMRKCAIFIFFAVS